MDTPLIWTLSVAPSVSELTGLDGISCRMTKMKSGHFPPSYPFMLLCVTHEFKTITTLRGRG